MLLAGIVTAAIGFAAAWWLWRDGGLLAGERQSRTEAEIAALDKRVSDAEAAAKAAQASTGKAASAADLAAFSARIDKLEAAQEAADAARGEMAAKIEDLRQRPAETDPEAVAAYERELAAMREMFDKELQHIRDESDAAVAAQKKAAAASTNAEALAALSQIDTAMDTGADFSASLDQLASLNPDYPVEPLRPYARGVETLAALQRDFPPAARAAIEADAAQGASGGGVKGFLKAQLGMRSLAPKSGSGADAVLSRAEARLREGDLNGTMSELDALTGPAADAMSAWRDRARNRLAALAAFQALSEKVRG